jgi:DedD protein
MSREAELYKDKIEVSLDGRQIFYLFFGGAVIVGLVFVLGVMVGRRVEARGHVDRARVAATVDPLAALDRLEGGNGLSFQGSLRGGDAPASDVEKQIAAMPKLDDKLAKKPDTKPATKPAAMTEVKAEAAKPETKVEHKAEAAKPAEPKAEKSADKATDKATEKSAAKTEDKKTAEKSAEKSAEKPDDKKAEKVTDKSTETTTTDEKKRYTLQLSSFQNRHEAEAYLDTIKSNGYQAYVTEGAVDGKQYYRVRMGSYRSMDAANEAKSEFEKSAKKSAIITRL